MNVIKRIVGGILAVGVCAAITGGLWLVAAIAFASEAHIVIRVLFGAFILYSIWVLGKDTNLSFSANEVDERVKSLQEVRAIQGQPGNYDDGSYMLGMYNGLELALSIMEDREPEYKKYKKVNRGGGGPK